MSLLQASIFHKFSVTVNELFAKSGPEGTSLFFHVVLKEQETGAKVNQFVPPAASGFIVSDLQIEIETNLMHMI